MEVVRVTKNWQLAGVYYVRIEAMVRGFGCKLDGEFGPEDKWDTPYILALDDGFPVGTCRIHYTDEGYAKIERVSVLDTYRGKGVGRAVITAAEEWIREQGVTKVVITSRDEAVGFYEALGYQADWEKMKKWNEEQKEAGTAFFTLVYTEKNL